MKTQIIAVNELSQSDMTAMYEIMVQYYEKVTREDFIQDLLEKQKVILLFGSDRSIKGFSTILERTLRVGSRDVVALYSGDTVLRREHWGNGALALAFGRYLMSVKLRHPLTDVYWFLISKGYKTYLLMTNNFPDHYPRFERVTPSSYVEVMNAFYGQRFAQKYSAHEGLIYFEGNKAVHLKDYVAEITEECRQNPRIAFFEKKNPQWKNGVELACVAKVSLWVPVRYVLKRVRKTFAAYGKGFKAIYHKQQ